MTAPFNPEKVRDRIDRILADEFCSTDQLAERLYDVVDTEVQAAEARHAAALSPVLQERDALAQWKREALTVESWWARIDKFVRAHPNAILGRSVAEMSLEWLKERDALKAELAEAKIARDFSDAATELIRERAERAEKELAQYRCPIGLEATPMICSAGTCFKCKGLHAEMLRGQLAESEADCNRLSGMEQAAREDRDKARAEIERWRDSNIRLRNEMERQALKAEMLRAQLANVKNNNP